MKNEILIYKNAIRILENGLHRAAAIRKDPYDHDPHQRRDIVQEVQALITAENAISIAFSNFVRLLEKNNMYPILLKPEEIL